MARSGIWLYGACLLLLLISSPSRADDADLGDDGMVVDAEDETVAEVPKEEYVAPHFQTPTIEQKSAHFVDWFSDVSGIGKTWMKSTAKKEGAEEALSKYNGEWAIGMPTNEVIKDDFGLIVKTKARHHAIAASLRKPFKFEGKPLVVQYEVKYEEGQECGGGYLKLLSANSNEKIDVFHDKTPYTIMFGPDKCGMTSKVHFILKHQNPKNKTISEHQAKQPSRSLSPFFDDKKTHLYTLVVKPDNKFQVLIDNSEIIAGNLLTDLEPSIVPPKQIYDPEDKKPADWDERETIEDKEAKKPEDWDENASKEIVDEDAQKPSDWLEEEESLVPDTQATKPEDWDEEMDGKWEPKKISNPKCEGISGCGKWTAPMKTNPNYKGKWSAPKIANPTFKGKWSAQLIDNPNYFESNPYAELAPIGAIGFELWTMSSGIVFDNIILTDDVDVAREFARQTFNLKVDQEKLFDSISNPSQMQSMWSTIKSTTEERPWLWAVYVLVLLIPVVLISVFCFGKKSPSTASHPKKTDESQPDEYVDEEMDEPVVEEAQEGEEEENAAGENVSTASSSSKSGTPVQQQKRQSKRLSQAANNNKSKQEQQQQQSSQSEESNEEEKAEEQKSESAKESASPTTANRRARVRRVD